MKGTYFLVGVVDESYTSKEGVNKPYFAHYFRDGEGKITVRKANVKMCDDLSDDLISALPRVSVEVEERTFKDSTYLSLKKVDMLR